MPITECPDCHNEAECFVVMEEHCDIYVLQCHDCGRKEKRVDSSVFLVGHKRGEQPTWGETICPFCGKPHYRHTLLEE